MKAYKADTLGNLVYRYSARNFNQDMAAAAKCVIAEVEHIVQPGELDPDEIHTPCVYVNRIVQCNYDKRIERRVNRQAAEKTDKSKEQLLREKIVKRAVGYLTDGMYLNLGIGIPTLVPAFAPKNIEITLQSENGVLGVGDYPIKGEEDADLINAGKVPPCFSRLSRSPRNSD